MKKTQLYLKVECEHESDRDGQRLTQEIVRAIGRIYGVRLAELQNSITEDIEPSAEEDDF